MRAGFELRTGIDLLASGGSLFRQSREVAHWMVLALLHAHARAKLGAATEWPEQPRVYVVVALCDIVSNAYDLPRHELRRISLCFFDHTPSACISAQGRYLLERCPAVDIHKQLPGCSDGLRGSCQVLRWLGGQPLG